MRRAVLRVGLVALTLSGVARQGQAQPASLSRVSLESVTMIDVVRGDGTTGNPDASLDVMAVARIGRGWTAIVQPWFFKSSTANSDWIKEIYQAAVRHERPGRVATRLEAGFISSPIGLGMLDMRADTNPLLLAHMSYIVGLPAFEKDAPAMRAIAKSYPLGAVGTVSTTHWDVRAAIVSAAPTRKYALYATPDNPQHTPVTVLGGGITFFPGFRVGASYAGGHYASSSEVSGPVSAVPSAISAAAPALRMWNLEGELAFGYTRLSAEYTRERFIRSATENRASTWFIQGTQTLAPRWFVAGRSESITAPAPLALRASRTEVSFRVNEAVLGYRVTRDLTLKSSVIGQRYFMASAADKRAGVQLVWSRRWW